MVNHLRTLLLNIAGASKPVPSYPGEEYVDPNFVPLVLTPPLTNVHELLFGFNPDRAILNWILAELAAVWHLSELSEFVLALDPRITYWPQTNNSLFILQQQGPQITPISTTHQIFIQGTDQAAAVHRINYNYTVLVVDGSHVKVTDNLSTNPPITSTYVTVGGDGGPVRFQGSDRSFIFEAVPGSSWNVTWLARPAKAILEAYHDLSSGLGQGLSDTLFGSPSIEPYLTFRNLWEQNIYVPYKVGAVALALGYRINELW